MHVCMQFAYLVLAVVPCGGREGMREGIRESLSFSSLSLPLLASCVFGQHERQLPETFAPDCPHKCHIRHRIALPGHRALLCGNFERSAIFRLPISFFSGMCS